MNTISRNFNFQISSKSWQNWELLFFNFKLNSLPSAISRNIYFQLFKELAEIEERTSCSSRSENEALFNNLRTRLICITSYCAFSSWKTPGDHPTSTQYVHSLHCIWCLMFFFLDHNLMCRCLKWSRSHRLELVFACTRYSQHRPARGCVTGHTTWRPRGMLALIVGVWRWNSNWRYSIWPVPQLLSPVQVLEVEMWGIFINSVFVGGAVILNPTRKQNIRTTSRVMSPSSAKKMLPSPLSYVADRCVASAEPLRLP